MVLRVLRLPRVMEATDLKKTTIFEAVAAGRFPKPIKLLENGRAVGWLESDIIAWLESRIAARDAA